MNPTAKAALIGSRIRSRRRELRMSQEFLSSAAHIDRHALCRYEYGRVEIPRPVLVAIATALVIEPEKLDPDYLGTLEAK